MTFMDNLCFSASAKGDLHVACKYVSVIQLKPAAESASEWNWTCTAVHVEESIKDPAVQIN